MNLVKIKFLNLAKISIKFIELLCFHILFFSNSISILLTVGFIVEYSSSVQENNNTVEFPVKSYQRFEN